MNFESIDVSEYLRLEKQVRDIYRMISFSPSAYDLIMAVAILYYKQMECDIVVLETGMGGKNDPTNVVCTTEAAVFTNIGLDHTLALGDTVEKIAQNKSHIIKDGSDVILYPSEPPVNEIIEDMCVRRNASLHIADFAALAPEKNDRTGQVFCYKERRSLGIGLLGNHQLNNAAVILETIDALKHRGWYIPDEAVYDGLKATRWPCRFEILAQDPYIVADVAHNPQGIQVLCETLDEYFPDKKIHVIFGCMKDKDYHQMLLLLKNRAERVFFVKSSGERPLDTKTLEAEFLAMGGHAIACQSTREAVKRCFATMNQDDLMLATGTFHMMPEFKASIKVL